MLFMILVGMDIDEIAAVAGGIGKLAEAAGVHWSTVCSWKRTKQRLVPVHRARQVSDATGIPLHVLRPDIWAAPRKRRKHHDLVTA